MVISFIEIYCNGGLNKMTYDEIIAEKKMIEGNVNRMIVTNDLKELNTQFTSVIDRIYSIYISRYDELIKHE